MFFKNRKSKFIASSVYEGFQWLCVGLNAMNAATAQNTFELSLALGLIIFHLLAVFQNQNVSPLASSRRTHHSLTALYTLFLVGTFAMLNRVVLLDAPMFFMFNLVLFISLGAMFMLQKIYYKTTYHVFSNFRNIRNYVCALLIVLLVPWSYIYSPWCIQSFLIALVVVQRYDMRFNVRNAGIALTKEQHADVWNRCVSITSSNDLLNRVLLYQSCHVDEDPADLLQCLPLPKILFFFSEPNYIMVSDRYIAILKAHINTREHYASVVWDLYSDNDAAAAERIRDFIFVKAPAHNLLLPSGLEEA